MLLQESYASSCSSNLEFHSESWPLPHLNNAVEDCGSVFPCPGQEIENGEFRGKTLEVPEAIPLA